MTDNFHEELKANLLDMSNTFLKVFNRMDSLYYKDSKGSIFNYLFIKFTEMAILSEFDLEKDMSKSENQKEATLRACDTYLMKIEERISFLRKVDNTNED